MIDFRKKYTGFVTMVIVLFVFLTACDGKQELMIASVPDQTAQPTSLPTATPLPSQTSTPAPTFTPTVTPVVVLDPEPIEISFVTEDGAELYGIYYPAEENPAPILVLVHWAKGGLTEWEQIAPWLQDRGLFVRSTDYNHSWKSSDWYPESSVEGPLGIFAFTLRECTGGCQSYLPVEWLLDIQAAMEKVSGLQGVDKDRILTAGASIGADGALFGCAWLNQTELGHCKGSFSLSPASLLTVPYEELARQLIDSVPPLPLYCLYGLRDDASVETCSDLPGLHSVDYGYIENHGMELIQPGQNPDPLILLSEFINTSLERVGE